MLKFKTKKALTVEPKQWMCWDLPENAKGQKQNKTKNKEKKNMPKNILHQMEELFIHSIKYIKKKPPIVIPKKSNKEKEKDKTQEKVVELY